MAVKPRTTKARKLLDTISNYVRNIRSYKQVTRRRLGNGRAIICFDLKKDIFNRYLLVLANYFVLAGFDVVYKHRFRHIASLCRYCEQILTSERIWLRMRSTKKNYKYIFKWPHEASSDENIALSPDYFSEYDDRSIYSVPITFHPLWIEMGLCTTPGEIDHLRIRDRYRRIFFAGNISPTHYSESRLIESVFNLPNRTQSIQVVESSFGQYIEYVKPAGGPIKRERKDEGRIALATDSSNRLSPIEYAEILSRSDFFLCFPGVVMPLCHNIVEAMSKGAIPIVGYPELMHPPLATGKNCLAYTDVASLRRTIEKALQMDASQVRVLRNAVLKYYGRYLEPGAVIRNLLVGLREGVGTVRVCAEASSVEMVVKRRGPDHALQTIKDHYLAP